MEWRAVWSFMVMNRWTLTDSAIYNRMGSASHGKSAAGCETAEFNELPATERLVATNVHASAFVLGRRWIRRTIGYTSTCR
jgi:hypothetical protein